MNSIAFYPVWAQQTTSNSTTMTSIMMDSTRLHLNAARNALMNGTKEASDQITTAQMQLSMLHMKSMGTMNEMQALALMRAGGAGASTSKMVRELHYASQWRATMS